MAASWLKVSSLSTICSRVLPRFGHSTRNLQTFSRVPTFSCGYNVLPSGLHRPMILSSFPIRQYSSPMQVQRNVISSYSTIRQNNLILRKPGLLGLKQTNTPYFTVRGITIMSKLGKRKTCKAVAKRFLRTGKGKLKRWRAGKNHNMMNKRNKRRKQLKKPTYVSKQQLKLLNKMLNGW